MDEGVAAEWSSSRQGRQGISMEENDL